TSRGSRTPFASIDFTSSRRSPTLVRGWAGLVSISSIEMNRPSDSPNLSASDSTKWESWRIRASVGNPRLPLDTREHLLGKGVVLRRPGRARRKSENRLPVRGTLLEPHALGDRGLEELLAEDRADLDVHVLRDHGPAV